jgi:4-hydroxythreonine-4-phosphate dehydrogenase
VTILAVSPGDPAGVGPEISARAVAALREEAAFLVFGDAERMAARFEALGVPLRSAGRPQRGEVALVDCARWSDDTLGAHAPSAEGGRAQLRALDAATDAVLAGEADALVTGPTSKAAVVMGGTSFTGQTEHLAARCGLPRDAVTMLFLGPRLRVALVTTHLSVREAADAITEARVHRTTTHLVEALRRLGTPEPHVVVTGLNPHAGEGGLFGREEGAAIAPVCARPFGSATVEGPMGAETAFRLASEGTVDGVVTMLHDQATIASKLLDWRAAVNVTWGLPFVRASVDHGVAYDAAAADRVDSQGMEAAIRCGAALAGPG